jgi:hypothetical protein
LLLIIIASATAILLVTFFPRERLIAFITKNARDVLKRSVSIGSIDYSFRGVTLHKVIIKEDDSDASDIMADMEEAGLSFSPISLLERRLDIRTISIKDASINILFDKDGISNLERLILTIKNSKEDSPLKASISMISFENTSVTLKSAPEIIAPLIGSYRFDGDLAFMGDKSIEIENSTLRLPEKRGTLKSSLRVAVKKDDFEVRGTVKLEKASMQWIYGWNKGLNLPYNIVTGTVTDLIVTKSKVSGHAKAVSTLTTNPKPISVDGSCLVDIKNENVILSYITGTWPDSSFIINRLTFNFNGDITGFSLSDINALFSDIRSLVPVIPQKLYGRGKGRFSYKNRKYHGELTLINAGFDSDSRLLDGVNTSISIKDNTFSKSNVPVVLMGYPCRVSVASSDKNFKSVAVNIDADKIIFDQKKQTGAKPRTSFSLPFDLSGKINVSELKYDDMVFTGLQISYGIAGELLKLQDFRLNFAEGQIMGNGTINIAKDPPRASLNLLYKDLKMQSLLSGNEKMKNRLFGKISELGERLLKTATGKLDFSIDRGKLVDTGIQDGLGLLLSELKYKLRDLEFSRISGSFDIKSTVYTIKSFLFSSDNIRVKVTGTFSQKMIASPLIINLEFTKSFLSDLPYIITLGFQKYYKGEWYSVPFQIDGDFTNSKNVKRMK